MAPADVQAFIDTRLSERHFAAYVADDARYLVLVAEAAGELVGYTLLVLPREPGEPPYAPDVADAVGARPAAELSKCYVLPAYQGTGVAGVLLEATLDTARTLDVAGERLAVVWLGTNQGNRRAQRSYSRHGFTVVGTRRFRVGDSLEQDLVMARALHVADPTAQHDGGR
ncbi:GNAT family N-acetyltransferase [Georgenia sp. SYP-B2076]|uniref:GNAT family N-acetyltransferase n=1 Tax=Georgenia sp. SYP-B2076 TaxID=2495881 RepID=UPI001F0C1A75|nr:GNAT family N-acetyltransferase [Georgenia sp. SYP-B2076]